MTIKALTTRRLLNWPESLTKAAQSICALNTALGGLNPNDLHLKLSFFLIGPKFTPTRPKITCFRGVHHTQPTEAIPLYKILLKRAS